MLQLSGKNIGNPARVYKSPLGECLIGVRDDNDRPTNIINRRYDTDIVIPYEVSPSDIASCLTYRELSDKLLVKYNLRSSMNSSGEIEFR